MWVLGECRQQVRGADGRCAFSAIERCPQPRRFEPFAQAGRKARLAAQIMRQAIDRTEQPVPDAIQIDDVPAKYRQHIAFTALQQLDKPVLYLDVSVRACFTQAGRIGECLCAGFVEAAEVRRRVAGRHGIHLKKMVEMQCLGATFK